MTYRDVDQRERMGAGEVDENSCAHGRSWNRGLSTMGSCVLYPGGCPVDTEERHVSDYHQ